MTVIHVVGARPNFMKVAPVMREMARFPDQFEQTLVHTGQHYDENMSQVFFDELDLPKPSINLEVGSGTHAAQTAQIMMRFEPILLQYRPDWVFVPGDVNSTLACSLVASKLGINVAHVEAGLRSFDRTMPEELNRLLTDQLSDLLFTPSRDADENLLREGIAVDRIHFVGNVMIDTLVKLAPIAETRWQALRSLLNRERFILVTLHRPSNVDNPARLRKIMSALEELAAEVDIVFPVHPRTRAQISKMDQGLSAVKILEPLSYLDFLALETHASLVLTDSGGIQEETTYLGVPCLTLRANTERPVTISEGTNQLVTIQDLQQTACKRLNKAEAPQARRVPEFWDGRTAERIVQVLREDAFRRRAASPSMIQSV